MAHEEHLALLWKQGVRGWNKWRYQNPEIIPDLSEADLSGTNLIRINLSKAKLIRTNLNKACLRGADFRESDFSEALLRESDLAGAYFFNARSIVADLSRACIHGTYFSDAELIRTNFNGSDLSGSNFARADLYEVDFSESNLSGSNFSKAKITKSIFRKTNLEAANLSQTFLLEANFKNAILAKASLSEANLSLAHLQEAILTNANLAGANLAKTDLRDAILNNADLSLTRALGTDFRKADLTGACLENWHYNDETKFKDVVCKYFYWKSDRQERRPSDEENFFEVGEFTTLFNRALSTVDLIFRDGVDWNALLTSLQKVRIETEGMELSIQAIENKNNGAFVIRVNVPHEANKAEIEKFLKQQYELEVKAIDEKYQFQLQLQGERLEEYRDHIRFQRQENTDLRRIVEKMADKEAPKYDMRGSTFGNFADTVQSGAKFQDTQNIYSPEQRQNLAEAAAEIQSLLAQLTQTNPTSTEVVAEAIHQEIKRNPTLKARLVSALKAGGLESLKAIFNHPLFSIPAETVKGWLEAE